MKFNLPELLALPLLFIAISLVIPFFNANRYPIAKRASSMVGVLEELTTLANGKHAARLASVSAKEVSDMIADPNSEFDELFGYGLRSDIWGNPYLCVEHKEASDRWHFYSKGVDRNSHSNGSDEDDLNSWDLSHEYYVKFEGTRDRRHQYALALVWTVPIFAILICVRRYCFRRRRPYDSN